MRRTFVCTASLSWLTVLALLAILLVSCVPAGGGAAPAPAAAPAKSAQEPASGEGGNILLYGGNQDIDNIDPATGENYSINAALVSLYDALYIVRGDKIEPNLIDSFAANDDATVFTIKLKQQAKFHDGSPVNAKAVVYSFNRLLEISGPPTYRWANIADQKSAQALDEYTVKFSLTKPFAPFIGTLTQLYVVNPAIVEANKGSDFGQSYLKEIGRAHV